MRHTALARCPAARDQRLDNSEATPGPEGHAFHYRPGPEAKRVIAATLERLHNIEDELRIVEGFLTHGAGFAAFLRLSDSAPGDPTLIHQYEQCYADAWNSLDDLATDTIEALGWRDALHALKQHEGIQDDYLTWNLPALQERLHEMYSFVTLDGLIHAFHR